MDPVPTNGEYLGIIWVWVLVTRMGTYASAGSVQKRKKWVLRWWNGHLKDEFETCCHRTKLRIVRVSCPTESQRKAACHQETGNANGIKQAPTPSPSFLTAVNPLWLHMPTCAYCKSSFHSLIFSQLFCYDDMLFSLFSSHLISISSLYLILHVFWLHSF